MDIKKYLEEYKIRTANQLVSHIVELKRNTSPDFKLISELVHHLEVEYNDFGIYKDDVITSPNRGEKEMFKLQENKDTQEKFTKCVNYIYREKPKRPKNVIVRITEKVNSNKNNTSYLKQPKIKDTSLKEIKEATINATNLNFDIKDILDIISCDTKEDIHRLVEKQIAERDKLNIYPLTPEECIEKERIGVKQNQTEQKAPMFTYCKVNKNALEALSLRALYGHNKYKQFDQDWQNFTRVDNGDFEYGNSLFRHALAIGGEETEEEHLIAAAWNAVARLEIYFRNKLNKS